MGYVKEDEYKRNESSSDESDWETEDEEIDMNQIRKVIGDIFPSKYMSTRVDNKDDTKKQKDKKEDKGGKITKSNKNTEDKKTEDNNKTKHQKISRINRNS